jgi:hypothetical protein
MNVHDILCHIPRVSVSNGLHGAETVKRRSREMSCIIILCGCHRIGALMLIGFFNTPTVVSTDMIKNTYSAYFVFFLRVAQSSVESQYIVPLLLDESLRKS